MWHLRICPNVIMLAKFQDKHFRDSEFTDGQNLTFSTDFTYGS